MTAWHRLMPLVRRYWPALFSLAYSVLAAVLVSPARAIGWDEAVYYGQATIGIDHIVWAPTRALGIPMLIFPPANGAPESMLALRLWIGLYSALFMSVMLWSWQQVVGRRAAVFAAASLLTFWIGLWYQLEAFPNWPLALVLCTLAGFICSRLTGQLRGFSWLAALCGFLATMIRPTDATVALICMCAVAVVGWSAAAAKRAIAMPLVGAAVGWIVWTIESFSNFGSPLQRLQAASALQRSGATPPRLYINDYLGIQDSAALINPLVAPGWLVLTAIVALVCVGMYRNVVDRRVQFVLLLPALANIAFYLDISKGARIRMMLPAIVALSVLASMNFDQLWRAMNANARRVTASLVLISIVWVGCVNVLHARAFVPDRNEAWKIAAIARDTVHGTPCILYSRESTPVFLLRSHCEGGDPSHIEQAPSQVGQGLTVLAVQGGTWHQQLDSHWITVSKGKSAALLRYEP